MKRLNVAKKDACIHAKLVKLPVQRLFTRSTKKNIPAYILM